MKMQWIALLFGVLAAPAAAALSLQEVLQAVWQRQPEVAALAGQEQAFNARQQLLQRWSSGPPEVQLAYEQAPDGRRELESELALPLWRPGQQQRQQQHLQHERQLWQEQQLQRRWQLAGSVREALWQQRLAELAWRHAEQRLALLREQEQDAARQERAGELAPLQLNQLRLTLTTAEVQAQNLHLDYQRAAQEWQRLTGSPGAPAEREAIATADWQQHPQLLRQRAQLALQEQELRLSVDSGRAQPELGLALKREQEAGSGTASHAVRLSLRLPLGSHADSRPAQHQATAGLAEQRLRLQQDEEQLRAEYTLAAQQLQLAARQEQMAGERLRLTQTSHGWQKKAWQLGELALADWLRARLDLLEAEYELQRSTQEYGRAIARHNQSAGVLP